MTREALLHKFESIRTWRKGPEEAPHKPLLLLLALAAVQREGRWLRFRDVNEPFKQLLAKYGPERSSYHSEFPFWRLKHDDKGRFWEVLGDAGLARLQDCVQLSERELLDHDARGGFRLDVYDALRTNKVWLEDAAHLLLAEHLPNWPEAEVARSVGLALSSMRSPTDGDTPRRR